MDYSSLCGGLDLRRIAYLYDILNNDPHRSICSNNPNPCHLSNANYSWTHLQGVGHVNRRVYVPSCTSYQNEVSVCPVCDLVGIH